jgi:L-lactate dehydrogenase complex protein LldG
LSEAREEILARIRRALGHSPAVTPKEHFSIAREYVQRGSLDPEGKLDLFIDRLHDYGAQVYRCTEYEIRDTIEGVLRARQKSGLLISPDIPREWLSYPENFTLDDGLSYEEIDRSEGVLTGCALAIAVTGTILLRHSAQEGRRALTLIPDYHLCVIGVWQVVEMVPEAIRAAAEYGNFPLTTISGPSATSDIEMTRIKGVHGPRTLDVILVE